MTNVELRTLYIMLVLAKSNHYFSFRLELRTFIDVQMESMGIIHVYLTKAKAIINRAKRHQNLIGWSLLINTTLG